MDRKRRLPDYNNENDRKLIRLFSESMQELRAIYFEAMNEWNKTKAMRILRQLNQISKALNDEYWKRSEYELTKEYVKGAYYINDVVKWWTVFLTLNKIPQKELNEMLKDYEGRLKHYAPFHIEIIPDLRNTKNFFHRANLLLIILSIML